MKKVYLENSQKVCTGRRTKGRSRNSWMHEITRDREGNLQHGMDRKGKMEKKNRIKT